MSTSVIIFYICVATFSLGVLAFGIYLAMASGKRHSEDQDRHTPVTH